jgi:hypothetical protein
MFNLFLRLLALFFVLCFISYCGSSQTVIKTKDKFGLMGNDGSMLLPAEFSDLHELLLYDNYKTDIYVYKKDKKCGLFHGVTKADTGLVIDSLQQDYRKGSFIFRIDNLWGMIIEPELYQFDWVMPKYKRIIQYSDGINPFAPSPYAIDRDYKGYSVSMDSLWGYASYKEDKLIIPMKYPNPIQKFQRSYGTVYSSNDRKSNSGYLIDPKTLTDIHVSDIVMTKEINGYYLDDHFIGNDCYLSILHLNTGRKILEAKMDAFELEPLRFRYISDEIIEVSAEAKRKNESKQEDELHIWYNVVEGTEVLRMTTPNCRQLDLGLDDDPTSVWMHVVCGGAKNKILGHIVNRKFVKQ